MHSAAKADLKPSADHNGFWAIPQWLPSRARSRSGLHLHQIWPHPLQLGVLRRSAAGGAAQCLHLHHPHGLLLVSSIQTRSYLGSSRASRSIRSQGQSLKIAEYLKVLINTSFLNIGANGKVLLIQRHEKFLRRKGREREVLIHKLVQL